MASETRGEGDGGGGGGGDTVTHLRELLKTEREQNEELVSVRDNQLARLQLELTSAGEERERERAQLEVVILELQQQLDDKQTELRALQLKKSSNTSLKPRAATFSKSYSPPPSTTALSHTHPLTHRLRPLIKQLLVADLVSAPHTST